MTVFLSDFSMSMKFTTLKFSFMFVSGNFGSDCVATGVFISLAYTSCHL